MRLSADHGLIVIQMVCRVITVSYVMGCSHGTLDLCPAFGLGTPTSLHGRLFRVYCDDPLLCHWGK